MKNGGTVQVFGTGGELEPGTDLRKLFTEHENWECRDIAAYDAGKVVGCFISAMEETNNQQI